MRTLAPFATLATAVLLAGPAGAADYDTKAYCARVGEMAGGSYAIERTCLEQEEGARAALAARAVAPAITKYCDRVGQMAGGSYAIAVTCADSEEEALAQLDGRTIEPRIRKYCDRLGRAAGGSYQITLTCVDQEEEARGATQ